MKPLTGGGGVVLHCVADSLLSRWKWMSNTRLENKTTEHTHKRQDTGYRGKKKKKGMVLQRKVRRGQKATTTNITRPGFKGCSGGNYTPNSPLESWMINIYIYEQSPFSI